jgi:hypothetical protein
MHHSNYLFIYFIAFINARVLTNSIAMCYKATVNSYSLTVPQFTGVGVKGCCCGCLCVRVVKRDADMQINPGFCGTIVQ